MAVHYHFVEAAKLLHHPHGHPKKAQRLTDPLRITARQVVVHRHHVDALSKKKKRWEI